MTVISIWQTLQVFLGALFFFLRKLKCFHPLSIVCDIFLFSHMFSVLYDLLSRFIFVTYSDFFQRLLFSVTVFFPLVSFFEVVYSYSSLNLYSHKQNLTCILLPFERMRGFLTDRKKSTKTLTIFHKNIEEKSICNMNKILNII